MRLQAKKKRLNSNIIIMITWQATIKEHGRESLLTPTYSVPEDGMHDHIDENFLIDFWGLNEPDVEWYHIEKLNDNGKK